MRKLVFLFAMLFAVTITANAQTQKKEQMVVNVEDLTPDQVAKIKARNELEGINNKIETYGKWAGMGKEVGTAVREGLVAVKDVTVDFADTDVGRITMGLIIWKVIGEDLKGIIFGLPLWIIGMVILLWSYQRVCLRRRVVTSREGGWWIFGGKREYETRHAIDESSPSAGIYSFIHWLTIVVYTGVMFGAVIF